MKSLYLNMYKKINYIAALLVLFTGVTAQAQITMQSPYSNYGLGNVKGLLLPQLRSMGGISTAVFKPSDYVNYINMQNPASYSGITLTTLDVGLTSKFTTLKKGDLSENSFNSSLSHIALAFPVKAGRSALSIGLLPYTEMGYKFTDVQRVDTTNANLLYSGEGGLTKAYIGYGQQFGEHFRIGGNIEYVFGNLIDNRATEFNQAPSRNVRQQDKNSVGGISFSYGAQYDISLGNKKKITFGYSGSSASKVSSQRTYIATQYLKDANGEEFGIPDTVSFHQNKNSNLKLPLVHNFGISIQKDNKWMVGADYRTGTWSKLSIDGINQGLQDSWGASLGGQYIPDVTSIGSYAKRIEYRLGLLYDKTYIRMKDQDIKQMAVTFGFGLPLQASRYSVYKLNFTTEIGKRGTLTNNLVQENYVNFHLGFTLNDTWFQRYRLN